MKPIINLILVLCININLFSQISFTNNDRQQRIIRDMKVLSHDTLMGRKSASKYESKAGNYIINELNKLKSHQSNINFLPAYDTYRFAFTIKNYENNNKDTTADIIAYIDNNAPYTIIIGAHYDHVGYEIYDSTKGQYLIYNGADDNASGTVGLLELTRHLSNKFLTNYNYIICFWGSEEIGLYGSAYFCQKILPNINVPPIILYINYDMIGSLGYKKNILTIYGTATANNLKDIVPNYYDSVKINKLPTAFPFSDHTCFYANNIPYLYFTTGLPKTYHTIKDEINLINFNGILFTIKLTEHILSQLNPQELQFKKIKLHHYIHTGIALYFKS
jgi:Zn-dependent M28 family amino/carboxypeptidase